MEVIRTGVTGHEDDVATLTEEYFTEANRLGREWFDEPEYGPDVPAIVESDIERLRSGEPSEPLFVVFDYGEIAGMGQLHRHNETLVTAKRIFVRESYRGKGLGRALVEATLDGAAADGFETLHLNAAPYHDRARDLYRTLGFEPVPTPGWTSVSPAYRDDWYFFELSLDQHDTSL
jgi:GNAT superfamily N-acetyltransferase